MTPDMSVIIPTLNRASSLARTLETLAAQETDGAFTPPHGSPALECGEERESPKGDSPKPRALARGAGFTYEVVVVDNGSTDDTADTIARLARAFPVPLRRVTEPRRGRPQALNTGLREAAGAMFVVTDDDLLISPGWLRAFWRCFQEERPDGVAGRVLPRWTGGSPAWLANGAQADLNRLGLGCLDHGAQRISSRSGRYCRWVGGNMAIRRQAVERVGGFDERFIRGQDREFYERCVEQGLVICYEPEALAHHLVGADRVTPAYFRRWRGRQGAYDAYLLPWRRADLLTIVPLWWYGRTLRTLGQWAASVVRRRPWAERFRHELALRHAGSVWARRLQLWPRWWLTVVTGRPHLPAALGTDVFKVRSV